MLETFTTGLKFYETIKTRGSNPVLRKILGSESFTRWLVSLVLVLPVLAPAIVLTLEIEIIEKFLHPHCLLVYKVQLILPSHSG